MLIDTHCHLDAAEFDADREAVLAQAVAAGVRLLVLPAVEAGNFEAVRALAHAHPQCCYALGIHPMYVDRADDGDLARLEAEVARSIDDPKFVAIGEIGLDHHVDGLDHDRQRRFFDAQLRLARRFELPVVMHVRRAQDAVLQRLRLHRPPGGIAHAFNGSLQQAHAFLDLGCALGFGGAMTFDRALQIRRLVTDLPASAHVLETDAPDIPPAWRLRERNAPAELAPIARVFADLRGVPLEAAAAQASANAQRVLPRLARLLHDGSA